jgi:Flp pilus assembly secretin CpaC
MRCANLSFSCAVLLLAVGSAHAAAKTNHHTSAAHKVAAQKLSLHRIRVARRAPVPSISVPLDEVRVVAFSHPVATVYVGNPVIADVSVIDSRHAFILGKGFGATNIVALDADGKQLVNEHVSVFGHTGSTVILHRGVAQATYNCANSRCEVAPTPGDDKDTYASRTEQMTGHQDAGMKAASAAH